ncbi:MAG: HigA family addiction module antidote protein [Devosia sp.]|uniref:HigA family addiction module antitoxin n=1 Tax=Devosia sp. TaxID=1871048 RepID=UPI001A47492D|nr:HigA family addiction module antitoxin [Devosia sp.]MBL8600073.1 HigA family addiction module antidote protein [Devosia sp.]
MPTFKTPLHPGEILREEFLVPLGMSAGQLARSIDVPRTRIERIVREEMGISADTALRLARYFGTTPELWLNLQQSHEIAVSAPALRDQLKAIEPRAGANENFAAWERRTFG